MLRGGILVGAVTALLAGSGCTPADLATARKVTFDDASAYIIENHDRRRELRKAYYGLVDAVIDKCETLARGQADEDPEAALKTVQYCLKFIHDNYPELATFALLNEGVDSFQKLRDKINEDLPDAPTE